MSSFLPRHVADAITKANMIGPIEREFNRQQVARQEAIDGDYWFITWLVCIDELDVWAERERMKVTCGKWVTVHIVGAEILRPFPDPIHDILMRYIEKHGRMP